MLNSRILIQGPPRTSASTTTTTTTTAMKTTLTATVATATATETERRLSLTTATAAEGMVLCRAACVFAAPSILTSYSHRNPKRESQNVSGASETCRETRECLQAESMATESVADPQETTEVESQKQDEEEEGKVGKETSSKQGSDGEGFKVEAKPETSPEELVDAKDSEPSQAQAPEREADAANAGTTSVDASASLGDAEASAALAMEELEPMPPSGDADDLGPGQASDQADVADLQGDAEPKPKAARPTSAEASPEESGAQPAGPETTEALPEIVASGTTATEADGSQGLRLKEAAASASEDGPADPSGAQAAAEEQPTVSVVQDPVALQSAKQKHKVKAVPTQAQQFVSLAGKSAVTPSVDEDAHRFSKAEPVQAAGVEASPGSASPPPPPPPVSALEAKSISGMPPGGYKDSAAVGASNGPDTDSRAQSKAIATCSTTSTDCRSQGQAQR